MLFSNKEEIDKTYNRKLWQLNRWKDNEHRKFEQWLNVRKNKKPDTTKENRRQDCMKLVQESCRMEQAITDNNIKIKCCSCDKLEYWYNLSWWHWESRMKKHLCIHYMNIQPQCSWCNSPMSNKKKVAENYRTYLENKYTPSELRKYDTLCKLSWPFFYKKDHRDTNYEIEKARNDELKAEIERRWWGKPK